jgi:hypothetical protein
LIEHGANVAVTDSDGGTALHHCILSGWKSPVIAETESIVDLDYVDAVG